MFVPGPHGRLWVEIAGSGSPVVVFAHGLTSSSADIADMAAAGRGTRVLFDFRGHGRSDSPSADAGYDVAAMAADLDAVVRHTGARHAVGVSMGSSAILRLLADEPTRFERTVLIMPAQIDGPMAGVEYYAWLANRLLTGDPPAIAADTLGTDAVRALVARCPAWAERFEALALRMNADGMVHALRQAPGGPAPVPDVHSLARVGAPALIVAHEGDPGHDAAIARRLASLLPGTLEIAPEPLAMLDDMRAFGRHIAAFIGSPALVSR